jgi:membrane protein
MMPRGGMFEGMKDGNPTVRDAAAVTWLVVRESLFSFGANRGLETAATLAYYGFLSLMPFLLICVFLLGEVLRSSDQVMAGVQSVMTDLFPAFNKEMLQDIVTLTRTRVLGFVGAVLLIWSMTPFAAAMRSAIYRIFKTDRKLHFIKAKLVDVTAILSLMTLFAGLVAWRVFMSVRKAFNLDLPFVGQVLGLLVPFAATLLIMALFYAWFAPIRPRWQHLLAGSFTATVLLSVIRPLFGALLEFNPDFGYAFGSLKAIFLLIVWVYYTFAVILFGGEVMCNARRKDALLLKGLFLGIPLPKKGSWRLVDQFTRRLEPGEVLFREGDEGHDMYFIQKGSVEVRKGGLTLRVLREGEYFGELSMLLNTPRTADAVAASPDTALISISEANLDTLLRENPAIVRNLLKEMALRLKATNEQLAPREAVAPEKPA